MVWVMEEDGSIHDDITGAPYGGSRIRKLPPYVPTPVVAMPKAHSVPEEYERVSEAEAVREIRSLIPDTIFREPVGDKDGIYDKDIPSTAFIDTPRVYLGLTEARGLLRRLESHGYKIVKVIK